MPRQCRRQTAGKARVPLVILSLALPHPEGYNNVIMMTRNPESDSLSEVCAHVKHLGYAAAGRIRLYGEEFEVLSDPFPEDDGIAVHVKTKANSTVRVLQLPATLVQSAKGRSRKAA